MRSAKSEVRGENRGAQIIVVRGGNWAPARLSTTLRFTKFLTLSAGAATAANVRFTPTFAYDVDPAVGSTSMAGFNEYGAMYRFYRCTGSTIKCEFANVQAFNVIAYVIPQNVDPGANYSSAVAQGQLANTYSRQAILGPLTGNNNKIIVASQTTASYAGAWNHNVADFYTGSTSGGTPTNNWFWVVGVVGTATVSTGVDVLCIVDISLEFFELANPAV